MKKVAFRNLGCKVNEYEIEYMQQRMAESGFEVVPFAQKADIYVINTCTVTNIADRKSRQMLHQAKKRNKDAIVVAVGCYVQTSPEEAAKDAAIDIIIGNNHKNDIAKIVTDYINDQNTDNSYLSDLVKPVNYEDMTLKKTSSHTRAFIKIQDGCNQFCSYCAIPLARGRIRSRSLESILNEVEILASNGYQEVVLTGIHLSSYGIDFLDNDSETPLSYNELAKDGGFTNVSLLNVIREVAKIEKIKRIRLGSLEPRLITDEFLEGLSKIEKICPHFHLSLQSGCDKTLERMNRKYTTDEFRKSVSLLRKYFNNPAITTDVIVGFPGETKEEFETTVKFLKEIKFFEMHVFKYSKRKNTVASRLKDQVSDEDKDIRSNILLDLDAELSREFRKEYLNREVEVLIEEKKNGKYIGHTKEYIMVSKDSDEDIKGQILTLMLDGETLSFVEK
ncbi:MAG: tRNA (N(6)-L-threonylcarbamoyladenosine(37)-C(2))-methylthiotransferase MtaB [Lachnospiraceae bacterium]|nr:tRNA (N(6)-L-threonylcarbamoyladenosine(37)-C(2))-methylthiotransferase MtaB [Lachnospiraceae bacterium]